MNAIKEGGADHDASENSVYASLAPTILMMVMMMVACTCNLPSCLLVEMVDRLAGSAKTHVLSS